MLNIYFVTKAVLSIKNKMGTSLRIQWLRICLSIQERQVRSLSGEIRSHMQWSEGSLQ